MIRKHACCEKNPAPRQAATLLSDALPRSLAFNRVQHLDVQYYTPSSRTIRFVANLSQSIDAKFPKQSFTDKAITVAESLRGQGFDIRAQITWAKERLVLGRRDYHWQHEPCWYAVRTAGQWTRDGKQTTLWQIPSGNQDGASSHTTHEPVECMRRPLQNNSSPGQAVYDPFLGSGTTS
ncbi:MAG TPA: DNA methyltransferase [Xanthobacteraceae bacterium]|nr:DNA methyltransferase [Xanthobacteraceae bacterium]